VECVRRTTPSILFLALFRYSLGFSPCWSSPCLVRSLLLASRQNKLFSSKTVSFFSQKQVAPFLSLSPRQRAFSPFHFPRMRLFLRSQEDTFHGISWSSTMAFTVWSFIWSTVTILAFLSVLFPSLFPHVLR